MFFYPDIWVGTKYSFVPLHFDEPNNFLIQIYGEKRCLFFVFSQTVKKSLIHATFLLPSRTYKSRDTPIENNQSCLSKFPRLKNVQPIEVILKAGDVLYIPPYWWHQVQGLSLNISVTYLWKHTLSQVPPTLYFRLIKQRFYKQIFRNQGIVYETYYWDYRWLWTTSDIRYRKKFSMQHRNLHVL